MQHFLLNFLTGSMISYRESAGMSVFMQSGTLNMYVCYNSSNTWSIFVCIIIHFYVGPLCLPFVSYGLLISKHTNMKLHPRLS